MMFAKWMVLEREKLFCIVSKLIWILQVNFCSTECQETNVDELHFAISDGYRTLRGFSNPKIGSLACCWFRDNHHPSSHSWSTENMTTLFKSVIADCRVTLRFQYNYNGFKGSWDRNLNLNPLIQHTFSRWSPQVREFATTIVHAVIRGKIENSKQTFLLVITHNVVVFVVVLLRYKHALED